MKCPLIKKIEQVASATLEVAPADCLQHECAWWDESSSACAIWSLMSGLDALGKVIREIANKMPITKASKE